MGSLQPYLSFIHIHFINVIQSVMLNHQFSHSLFNISLVLKNMVTSLYNATLFHSVSDKWRFKDSGFLLLVNCHNILRNKEQWFSVIFLKVLYSELAFSLTDTHGYLTH